MREVGERSAGVIVFHAADRSGGAWEYLLLRYRTGGHWSFSKGHVEAGESDWQAALRELCEETGLHGIEPIPGFYHQVRYRFHRGEQPVDKQVSYFLAASPHANAVLSGEHTELGWFPYAQARERLTYDTDRRLLDQAQARLSNAAEQPR